MTVSTPLEAVKYFGYLATKGNISGIIIMVGEWVVEIHETGSGFNTTHVAYPFEVFIAGNIHENAPTSV